MEHEAGITQVIKGIADDLNTSGEKGEQFYKLAEVLLAQNTEKSQAAMAALGVRGSCKITGFSWSCNDGGPGIQYARKPISTGPITRSPIGWGGEECITVGKCTFCYSYECTPEVAQ